MILRVGMLLSLLSVACKPADQTAASKEAAGAAQMAANKPNTDGGGNAAAPMVSGSKVVSEEESPLLTVFADIFACVGAGKWLDASAATKLGGVVTVRPTRIEGVSSGDTQPSAWVLQPTSASDVSQLSGEHVWKLPFGTYLLEVTAVGVPTNSIDSNLSKRVTFDKVSKESFKLQGTWKSNKCELNFVDVK